ncbi:hypothetical protein [Metabacillus litoralis]|uniref:hypothetical protein n=1 Tax=Metabacillus litoralis TaxID=152268 RepID=UPI001CFCF904|nr:hypothetical protein [Metabacillus litoralis]
MLKREKLFLTIIGILLICNILSYSKISSLEERMGLFDSMQNEISNVNYSVQDLSSQIDMKLNEFMQNQLWIQKKEYQITNVNIAANKIDVVMEWSLKELNEGENISLLYREKTEGKWSELEVTKDNGLNYVVQHSFPLNGNYETQVVATSNEGERSESLVDLFFKEQLDQRIQTNAFVHQSGDGQLNVTIDINNTFKNELLSGVDIHDLKMKSAKAQLIFDEKLMKEWDLLINHEGLHYGSDSYSESINFTELLDVTEEVGNKMGNVKLLVKVKDGLGFTFDTEGSSEGTFSW